MAAVDVPVTLKIRTGWNPENRNGLRIAQLAEAAGIQALAVHGRTRDDLQEVQRMLKAANLDVDLQFINYR